MNHIYKLSLLGLGAAALAGCPAPQTATQNSASSGTANEQKLAIVSPHNRAIQAEFERLFKAKHPEVTFQWFDKNGTTELLKTVIDQVHDGKNGMGADLFFGGGAETFLELEKRDLLEPLPADYGVPAALNGVPLRGEKNKWVAAALSGFGILANQTFAKRDGLALPKTWGDLGDVKLMDRVELADPRKSGSAHTAYEVILQTSGWDKGWQALLGMSANARSFKMSSSDLVTDVQSGEAVFAPAIDFYGRAAVAKAGKDASGTDKLVYIEPAGQTVITPDPIGILKPAPHAALAKEFVQLVMSPAGQNIWLLKKGAPGGPTMEAHSDEEGFYRLASLPLLYKPVSKDSLVRSDPYATKNQRPYDAKKAAVRRQAIDALIGAVLIDNRDLLKAARKKNPALTFVPVGEEELTKIAAKWDDVAFRTKQTSEWAAAARAKFGG